MGLLRVEQPNQLLIVHFVNCSQLFVEADDIGFDKLTLQVGLCGLLVPHALFEHQSEGRDGYLLQLRNQLVIEIILPSRHSALQTALVEFWFSTLDVL